MKCRTFRDPNSPSSLGLILEIPEMAAFEALLKSDEGQRPCARTGLKGGDDARAGGVHAVSEGRGRFGGGSAGGRGGARAIAPP
ncbi:MAG: hypothetical protein IPK07_18995 [Deltaproteobacteria bacterium]|nr:hypothetical protein [Deltaproteobacteria bacterium]